ncbi:MAG TPA: hypothetical protein VKU01_18920 [Bryobacteraceae bacterium]|nr:hypothetical protein [Bryobacteraceae bacterium]
MFVKGFRELLDRLKVCPTGIVYGSGCGLCGLDGFEAVGDVGVEGRQDGGADGEFGCYDMPGW